MAKVVTYTFLDGRGIRWKRTNAERPTRVNDVPPSGRDQNQAEDELYKRLRERRLSAYVALLQSWDNTKRDLASLFNQADEQIFQGIDRINDPTVRFREICQKVVGAFICERSALVSARVVSLGTVDTACIEVENALKAVEQAALAGAGGPVWPDWEQYRRAVEQAEKAHCKFLNVSWTAMHQTPNLEYRLGRSAFLRGWRLRRQLADENRKWLCDQRDEAYRDFQTSWDISMYEIRKVLTEQLPRIDQINDERECQKVIRREVVGALVHAPRALRKVQMVSSRAVDTVCIEVEDALKAVEQAALAGAGGPVWPDWEQYRRAVEQAEKAHCRFLNASRAAMRQTPMNGVFPFSLKDRIVGRSDNP
ncbi:hypothetical protein [Streptomyces sp. NPDC090026]|uniref:hypothetical protein n=1 Tax=Streptomyces sp. NPDC090026 TaxID=3365923 RepID=UPI0038242B1E